MKWEYKGRKLEKPIVILRRLIAWPILYILVTLLALVMCFGWGYEKAMHVFEELTS